MPRRWASSAEVRALEAVADHEDSDRAAGGGHPRRRGEQRRDALALGQRGHVAQHERAGRQPEPPAQRGVRLGRPEALGVDRVGDDLDPRGIDAFRGDVVAHHLGERHHPVGRPPALGLDAPAPERLLVGRAPARPAPSRHLPESRGPRRPPAGRSAGRARGRRARSRSPTRDAGPPGASARRPPPHRRGSCAAARPAFLGELRVRDGDGERPRAGPAGLRRATRSPAG